MPVLRTLPGAWLQQTENGTAWTLFDDDVAKITGAKGQRRVILRAAAAAGCVVLRETAAATTLGDESDARRTIDEVAFASQAELPADSGRAAAVREAAAIAKDVDWDVCRLCVRSLALDLGQLEDHLHNIDEDERRRSHVAASVLSRACGTSDVERLQRLYLKLRFNAFPIDGGLALFKDASALNHDCAPNASLSFCEGQLSVVLGRDLKEGEEVRISYFAPRALLAPAKARRAALYTGFLFRCGCLRCASDGVLDAPIVDAAAEALARGLVDDRLGRALAVLANDCLGAATPLLRADLRLLAARRRSAKNVTAAAFGGASAASTRRLTCRRALDDEDPTPRRRPAAARPAFVVRIDRRRLGKAARHADLRLRLLGRPRPIVPKVCTAGGKAGFDLVGLRPDEQREDEGPRPSRRPRPRPSSSARRATPAARA